MFKPSVRRSESAKAAAGLVIWLGVLGAALGLLVRLKAAVGNIVWGDLGFWLRATPADQVLVAVMWAVAMALVCWLLVGTLVCFAAQASGIPGFMRAAGLLAPAVLRERIKRVVAVGAVAVVATAAPVQPAERPDGFPWGLALSAE